jgi:hypothetical protein
MAHPRFSGEEVEKRGQELYEKSIRAKVETDGNIGKILVTNIETGEYEMDADEIAASRRALARFSGAALWMLRIGYNAVHSLGGRLERTRLG